MAAAGRVLNAGRRSFSTAAGDLLKERAHEAAHATGTSCNFPMVSGVGQTEHQAPVFQPPRVDLRKTFPPTHIPWISLVMESLGAVLTVKVVP